MTKPGEQTAEQNKEYKHAMGKAPNSTANKFLAAARGHKVKVTTPGPAAVVEGTLVGFDLYSLLVTTGGSAVLIFKGPGVAVELAPE